MGYKSLAACLQDLQNTGRLVKIKEEIDPHLELAAVHLRIYEKQGPALLFEQVKGCKYPCASNIFGTLERSKFLFRDSLSKVQQLVDIRNDPASILQNPLAKISAATNALYALPKKSNGSISKDFEEISINDLPQIVHWPQDGGAFVTLPQVFSEDIDKPGIKASNLGMYRIQLSGNDYLPNEEIGLHYQLHRGIGVHQQKAFAKGADLKVSCFIGGPPAHTVAAVMPLPEGMSELSFAGLLGSRRFRYQVVDGYHFSNDADFVILGTVEKNEENKPEGPFGDHLGYYSWVHPFPVIKVHKVFARKDAIWPFTVVGRPPQEDTSFGALIHEITGDILPKEIPGLKEVNAVDAAGVHPLLLAVGSERYTPYLKEVRPAELLTIANHILGKGQLSLAKYVWIAADASGQLSTHPEQQFLEYMLERLDFTRDLHFYTKTTIDTLDYTGNALNEGSKVVLAAYGEKKRTLCTEVPTLLKETNLFTDVHLSMPGVVGVSGIPYVDSAHTADYISELDSLFKDKLTQLQEVAMIVLCDDSQFLAAAINNFLWVTFTRSNPATDIHGILSFQKEKHWGCAGPLIIDARIKPWHTPAVEKDADVERAIDRFFVKGASLERWG